MEDLLFCTRYCQLYVRIIRLLRGVGEGRRFAALHQVLSTLRMNHWPFFEGVGVGWGDGSFAVLHQVLSTLRTNHSPFFWGGGGGGGGGGRLGALYQVLPALGADHFTFDGEGGGGRFLSAQEFFFILIDKADIETM